MADNHTVSAPIVVPLPHVPRFPRWSARVCAAVALSAAVFIAAWTLADTVRLHHPLPYGDYWYFLSSHLFPFLSGQLDPLELWSQHNDHRILFPRLVFLADAQWFNGDGVFCVVVSWLLLLLHTALMVCLVLRAVPDRGAPRVLVSATVAACLLHGSQGINLFWAFQVQFIMVYWAIALSLHQLSRGEVGSARIVAAIVFGCIATGSMANGVLVWPLLWSLAAQRRLPLRSILVLVIAGAAMLFAFFHGYKSNHSPIDGLAEPLRVLQYLCAYLGNPLWSLGGVPTVVAGAATLLVAAWTVIRFLPRWFLLTPAEAVLLHVVLLVLGSGLLTAAGRLHLAFEDMLNSRYCTPALLLWSALLGIGMPRFTTSRWYLRFGGLTAFAVALALLAPGYRPFLQPIPSFQADASSCFITGVRDTECLSSLRGGDPSWIMGVVDVLRVHRLSVFSSGLPFLMGADLLTHFMLGPPDMATAVMSAPEPVPGDKEASRVEGWAYESRTGLPAELILVVDQNWRIVGLGQCSHVRADVAAAGHPVRDERVGYRAWIREADHAGRVLSVYAVFHGVAVPIAGAAMTAKGLADRSLCDDFDSLGPVAGTTDGAALGKWSVNGWHPSAPAPPFQTFGLGSWSGADSNTGVARVAIPSRTDDAVLLLPLLTGPDASALVLRIYDRRAERTQASLQMPSPFPDRWRLWRVPLPARPDGGLWVLEAQDWGQGSGQWFAFARPHWQREPSAPR